ncbi:MAG: hypothetical protein KDA41_01565, partial [Planctomycetales bacterium]|nr:hypothetical protein [Planctomycetales bacterium]
SMGAAAANISARNLKTRIAVEPLDAELAALAVTLNDAFDRLERDFDKQARFTADASHELRTPLTIILGHLDLALKQPDIPEPTRKSLEACQRAARRMRSLTEQLLLLAKADAGKLLAERQAFDFSGAIEESLELLAPLAEERQVVVHEQLEPVEIFGDPALLAQVAVNLISNAIVHNRPGGTATVALSREGAGAVLRVSDTGPGLPDDALTRVFERFYRADESRSRDDGGAGLGLAITRAIVELHGGHIQVASETDLGTEFVVRLPGASGPADHAPPA